MCLAFIAIDQHPDYPLLLLFNRDEDYARPTKSAHWWPGGTIYGGRDELKGGTWAAVNDEGKFAMLTFIRAPREPRSPTIARGEIVPSWMMCRRSARCFLRKLRGEAENCLGYNLIFGDMSAAYYYNNRLDTVRLLSKGIHGVSNSDLDDPWFKVNRGTSRIEEILQNDPQTWEGDCFALLGDQTLAQRSQVQVTGLNPERERLKSSLFVKLETYGTIVSSVIRFSANGLVESAERSFNERAICTQVTRASFDLKCHS
jgi:uncharacterized protein with NRDE domain